MSADPEISCPPTRSQLSAHPDLPASVGRHAYVLGLGGGGGGGGAQQAGYRVSPAALRRLNRSERRAQRATQTPVAPRAPRDQQTRQVAMPATAASERLDR